MAEAGKEPAGLAFPGGGATQWPLQRYGRFMPSGTGEPPGPGQGAGTASSLTWKASVLGALAQMYTGNSWILILQPRGHGHLAIVFDSSEESGYLVLTIVISGHFFISQGPTLLLLTCLHNGTQLNSPPCHCCSDLVCQVAKILQLTVRTLDTLKEHLPRINVSSADQSRCEGCSAMTGAEGFSLIGSKNWLKIVRRMDCLLFGTTIKNKSRMFRVQFSGGSKEQALESCCSCVQKLAQYVTVQEPDRVSQELRPSAGLLGAGESQGKDCAQHIPPQHRSHQKPEKQQQHGPAGTGTSGGRTSVSWLAQSLLVSEELSTVYEQSAWDTEDLRPFLRLCLMDQNFPAFVEEVEKELKKLTGLRN